MFGIINFFKRLVSSLKKIIELKSNILIGLVFFKLKCVFLLTNDILVIEHFKLSILEGLFEKIVKIREVL